VRITKSKLKQIINEEHTKLLSEADQLPPGVLTTEPINIKLYGYNPNLRPGAPALAQDAYATKYRKTMSQLHPNLSAEQLDAMVIRDRELRKALKITGKQPPVPTPAPVKLPGAHVSHGFDPYAQINPKTGDWQDAPPVPATPSKPDQDELATAALAKTDEIADQAFEQFGYEYDFELTSGMVPSISGKEISLKPAGPVSLGVDVGYILPPHVYVYEEKSPPGRPWILGKTGLYNEKTGKRFPFPRKGTTYASLPTHGMQFYNASKRQNVYISNQEVADSW
jgi:hypothetical protein